ncbi:MAG: tRNA(Met) cytidine acetyltransferase TmcA [Halolamina sp.]
MTVAALAANLAAEARRADERRVLVLAGDRDAGLDAAMTALDAADVPEAETTVVTAREEFAAETLRPRDSDALLGRTRAAVVCDCHDYAAPNALGRVVGAVDGGGLLVLLTPSLDAWPGRRDEFDASMAVPPFERDAVTGLFRRRLAETMRTHPGVAVVDVSTDAVVADGRTGVDDAGADRDADRLRAPPDGDFPAATYAACRTDDQVRAVRALEALRRSGEAVVVEADRGRGKSSAAGLAAAALAADGRDVLVTAPEYPNASEVFARARELLTELDALADDGDRPGDAARPAADSPRTIVADDGGRVRFRSASAATDLPGDPDAVVVDEAAALPVRTLTALSTAPAVAFCTTVRGYEGAGRSFDVRFRKRLTESPLSVTDVTLATPIRYAREDPVESWAFRALLLDASPAVAPAVADATPETAEYVALSAEELLADETRLREAFGLLVLAHYRTEPNDLARLLDAPNLTLRALVHDGHVVSVALLAREGGLDADTRGRMYAGERVRGNMFPDVLTSQLRDDAAAAPVGYRVVRIATHHAVRSAGLGSRLLSEVAAECEAADPLAGDDWESADRPVGVDYLSVGYGATPDLLRFWADNGYRTVHLSTTRNAESGEHSALMGRPLTDAGEALLSRHARWFRRRLPGLAPDDLADCDPDVMQAALAAAVGPAESPLPPSLDDHAWRVLAGSAWGGVSYTAAPGAARDLVVAGLASPAVDLDDRVARLLVRKLLQGQSWERIVAEEGFVSARRAMQTLGDGLVPLVERWGSEAAAREKQRHVDGD